MSWPPKLITLFELVNPATTDETEYYGPYNSLLHFLFPFSDDYEVAPQFKGPITPGSIDFTMIYVIQKKKMPVFFVEIKTESALLADSNRALADNQMRERFLVLRYRLEIPKLYGISAMGTKFAVYEYEKATQKLLPEAIPADTLYLVNTAPEERWKHSILEPEGAAHFRSIVENVKSMCKDLDHCKSYHSF
jgi:hypothetical protein